MSAPDESGSGHPDWDTTLIDAAVEICERVRRGDRFGDAQARVAAEMGLTAQQSADANALALNALKGL